MAKIVQPYELRTGPNKPYYTIPELAMIMGISRQAVDKRLRKAEVYFIRYGRTRVVKRTDAARVVMDYFKRQSDAQ